MKKFFKKIFTKKGCLIIGILLIIAMITAILLIYVHGFQSDEKKVEKVLRQMGENFYQNYYKQLASVDIHVSYTN
ncbi:MAG: hypothetical protein K2M17_02505, partial [Bacilli bacterium]|nr:hypothetical protein [Bacilli bacterium]